jgi:HK97 family phage major capsid protein
MSIQALREQRAAKAKSLNELVSKAEWNAAADQPVYDQGMIELDAFDAQIKNITDLNARIAEEALTETVIIASERIGKDKGSEGARVYAKWLRGGDNALSAEDWGHIRNTMSTTTNSEGGYTVATDVATTVLDALKAYGGMRAAAEIIRTAQGNPMSFPTSDGTTETGEIIAENTTATSADISFGTKSLPVYKYSSKVVAVPFELLQDSSVDVEAFVRGRLATRLGRITNTHFTTGTGSSQPNGIVTAVAAAGSNITAANSTSQVTAVIYTSLIDLVHAVDPAYREGGNCRWMMNDASIKVISKIVDGQSRPIFNPGYETGVPGGAPDMLLGYPITVNQDMATMAASAKSILFGDFNYYKIRDAMDIQMFRFTDSAYTKLGQVGFLAWMRSGGNFIDVGGAVRLFINAAS